MSAVSNSNQYIFMSPRWASTPRQTELLTVGRNVALKAVRPGANGATSHGHRWLPRAAVCILYADLIDSAQTRRPQWPVRATRYGSGRVSLLVAASDHRLSRTNAATRVRHCFPSIICLSSVHSMTDSSTIEEMFNDDIVPVE
jgi:hypothetical protein